MLWWTYVKKGLAKHFYTQSKCGDDRYDKTLWFVFKGWQLDYKVHEYDAVMKLILVAKKISF